MFWVGLWLGDGILLEIYGEVVLVIVYSGDYGRWIVYQVLLYGVVVYLYSVWYILQYGGYGIYSGEGCFVVVNIFIKVFNCKSYFKCIIGAWYIRRWWYIGIYRKNFGIIFQVIVNGK